MRPYLLQRNASSLRRRHALCPPLLQLDAQGTEAGAVAAELESLTARLEGSEAERVRMQEGVASLESRLQMADQEAASYRWGVGGRRVQKAFWAGGAVCLCLWSWSWGREMKCTLADTAVTMLAALCQLPVSGVTENACTCVVRRSQLQDVLAAHSNSSRQADGLSQELRAREMQVRQAGCIAGLSKA